MTLPLAARRGERWYASPDVVTAAVVDAGATLDAVKAAITRRPAFWSVDTSHAAWRTVFDPPGDARSPHPLNPGERVAKDSAAVWREFHARTRRPVSDTAAEATYVRSLADGLAKGCECRGHWSAYLKATPPDFDAYEAWGVAAHSAVNKRIGKPQLSVEQARPENTFARVVVISLARTPERLAAFRAAWPADWPFRPPAVFTAVDGDRERRPASFKMGGGAWGCLQSWRQVVQQAADDQVDGPMLVMEDDCQLTPQAINRIPYFMASLPDGWEVAYLGGSNRQPADTVIGPGGVTRTRGVAGTHAVVVHPRAFTMLLERFAAWDTHVDWCLRDMPKNEPERQFYAIKPYVAFQMANLSTITGVMNGARSWDDQVPVPTRPVESVPVVWLGDKSRAEVDAMRARGEVHTGYWRDKDTGIDNGLIALFKLPADEQPAALATWIKLVRAEAAAFPNAAVGVWHPGATGHLLEGYATAFTR